MNLTDYVFTYYADNRANDKRVVTVGEVADGYAASRWARAAYDGWPLERRLLAYLGERGMAWDSREARNAEAWDALYDVVLEARA